MGDDEQLLLGKRRPRDEELEDGAGPRHGKLMRRTPGGVLERLAVGVPLDADELAGEHPVHLAGGLGDERRRSVRSLGQRVGLRLFLRLYGRRDFAV